MAVNPYGLYDYSQQPEQPQGDKAATQADFRPQYSKSQLKRLISGYKQNPKRYNQEAIDKIKKHAIYHNVGFYEGEFSIGEALKQFGGGLLEGFTTLSAVDPPDNEYEAIARNVGHLLGFAPNMMAKPLKLLGLTRTANALGGIRSIPLGAGEYATKKLSKVISPVMKTALGGRADASGVVAKFLTSGATKSVVEEGFKLGVASAVSNWKQGVDGMIEAGIGGVKFGAAFGALGNIIPGKGKLAYAQRAVAGSIFQGLPATQRGATTPEQVYEYLLGAYFGGGASSHIEKAKQGFFTKMQKEAYGANNKKANYKLRATEDPTLVEGWKELDPEYQEAVRKEMNDPKSVHYNPDPETRTAMQEIVAKDMGIEPDKTQLSEKGWERYVKMTEEVSLEKARTGLARDTEKELNKLYEEKATLTDDIVKSQKKLDKLGGADRIIEEQNLESFKSELSKLKAKEKRLLDLNPYEFIDKETEDIRVEERVNDGNDIGMLSNMDLFRKSEIFVQDNLKEVWDKPSFSPSTKRNEIIRLTNFVDNIVKQEKYSRKNQKVNTEELVREIESTLKDKENIDITIDEATKDNFRQWLTRKNFGEPVKYLNVSGVDPKSKSVSIQIRGEDGFTLAGNRKQNIEPKMEVQRALEDILNISPDSLNRPDSHYVFDNITTRGPKGEFKDLTLSQYRKHLIKEFEDDGIKVYNKFIKKMHKDMWKKGFYPFGGKGDNDTIIYIKKHPDMNNGPKLYYINSFLQNYLSKGKNEKYFNDALKRNKYFSQKEAREMYLNNIMWDISLNGFKPKTATEYSKVLKQLFEGEGYIKNATAWNKRQQIWFTPTWKADKDFVANHYGNYLSKLKQGERNNISEDFLNAVEDGNVRYIISRDLDPKLKDSLGNRIKKLNKDSKNTEYDEHVDGMTIVEDNYLNSLIKDSGLPESGQSKNFIVSPDAENGALLGKHMMHSAGPEASRQMRKAGIQMIMQESAVKQRGERKITDYKIEKDELKIEDPNLIHEMPLENIKYGYNVKQSNTMAGYNPDGSAHRHGIPKQLLMAMAQNTHKPFSQKLIEDFFNETLYKKYQGDSKINEVYKEYVENPESKVLLNILEKSVDKLGMDNLLDAINGTPTEFTDIAYMRLMKINRENVASRVQEGEITPAEGEKILDNINEFNSSTDRIVEAAKDWAQSEKLAGRPGNINTVLLHKYIRPYRFQVIRNYVFQSLSKPKIGNSGVARMRGYDKWFRKDDRFKELETNDEVFYLDNSFKEMPLKTAISGHENTTLKRLWNAYKSGTLKGKELKKAEDALTALTVRVPMDSVSGAQRMKFGGFTERNGHGILMHSRAMRAEGGADLDGDEAFIFFAGREGAKGGGFKKKWIDKFHENKDEYLNKDGVIPDRKKGSVPGTKQSYEDYLTTQDDYVKTGVDPKARDSKVWQYDSQWRQDISERAVEGRNLLGGTVSMTQVLKAAHNSILQLSNKQDNFFRMVKAAYGKKPYKQEISIEARSNETELKNARQLASSMIAFTSDPLDVAGLTGYADYAAKLGNAYFKVKIDGKNVELTNENYNVLRDRHSVIGQLFETNAALYGRDYVSNKSWNAQEIKSKTNHFNNNRGLGLEKAQNSMLTKIGKLANTVDLYDSPYKNINVPFLFQMYKEHNKVVESFPEFKALLKNLEVPFNDAVRAVASSGLWKKSVLDKTAHITNIKDFNKIMASKGSPWRKGNARHSQISERNKSRVINSEEYRKDLLKEFVKFSEDILTQDVSDMVSFRQVYRFYNNKDIGPVLFQKILKKVSDLRRNSYLQRKSIGEEDSVGEIDGIKVPKSGEKAIRKAFGSLEPPKGKERSTTLDQAQIDAEIAKFKATLPNNRAQKMFDMLMLGTFRDGTTETSISKLGLSSKSVDKASVVDFIGDYANIMNKAYEKVKPNTEFVDNIKKGDMVEKDLPENSILEDTTTGYEGLHGKGTKKQLPKEVKQQLTELVENLKFYNGKIGQNLNEVTRGILGKDFNTLTYKDFVDLNNYFKELQRGTIFQRFWGDKKPTLKKRYTYQFPITIGRETMKYDIELLKKRGLFVTKAGEVVAGDMQIPSNFSEKLQHAVTLSMDKAQAKGEEEVGVLRKQLEFLDSLPEGELFRRIAVRKIEKDGNISKLLSSDKKLSKQWANNYLKEYNKEIKDSDYNNIKRNMYRITSPETLKRIEVSGEQLVEQIEGIYKGHFKKMHNIISGNKKLLDSYHLKNKKGEKLYWDYYDFADFAGREKPMEAIYDYKRFVKDIYKAYERGEDITTEFGIDGLRQIARSMMIKLHNVKKQRFKSRKKLREEIFLPESTGEIKEGYWPHMFFDKGLATKALREATKSIYESNLPNSEKQKELEKIQWRTKTLTGDWITGTENWEAYDAKVDPMRVQTKNTDNVTWFQANQMTGSMRQRTSHIPGWSVDATVAESYSRNIFKTYYKQLAQILSRDILVDYDQMAFKKGWDKVEFDHKTGRSLKDRWADHYKLYVQDAMGHPSIIPDYMINDPGMKLKGTPYAWWADNKVRDRVNKIAKKIGLKEDIPGMGKFSVQDIARWSNLEAKYELMSLLAHPKSMINNLFGGTLHTVQSVGATALKKARDYNFLRTINPEWTSNQAILEFVIKQGIFPEMLANEWGMQKEFQNAKSKNFLTDLTKRITNEGKLNKDTLRELADKHKVGSRLLEIAAKSMSIPEMALRRDAFMAHYIKAWEMFGGAITQHDHPFLIEMAKKGVKATQFLYSAPSRPAFSRTALGKVMTRFQLWSWNSARFRNDVMREARVRGYRHGTPEYEKFKRTAQIDLLVYSLGSVFAMSLFDNAIPAPLNHFKETTEWLFGDENTRNRAFWGTYPTAIAPLQIITPPISRGPISMLKTLTDDNYNKFFDYHLYTLFPFGRVARDISPWAKGNVLDNPYRTIEKFTGIPYGGIQGERAKLKKEMSYHPTYNNAESLKAQLED